MSKKDNTQLFNSLDEKLIKLGFLRQLITEARLTGKNQEKHEADLPTSSWNSGY